jgi:hypothetical protein
VIAAVSGGDGYDVGFALGVGLALGVMGGACVGALVFLARYAWQ